MSTEQQSNEDKAKQESEAKQKEIKESAKKTYGSIRSYLLHLLDIRDETDRDSTMDAIIKDIPFRGHNAWILIFSIIVASIGLNVSSTAVVIGAMLISPLMGPIVGLGFSVAINDVDTLRRSLINLGVMVGLSVVTAFLYFKISPLTELTPELAARTEPTILDVIVAIFGGLALIIAKTKKGTIASVIFGVAIATALMPPLCTAGYGLAVWDLSIFGGAIYLFTINTIFIALSTFVVSKVLKFPLVKYANSQRRRFIARTAYFIAIIAIIPSIYLFYQLLQESYFTQNAKAFVKEELAQYGNSFLQTNSTHINYNSGENPVIEVAFLGKEIPDEVIDLWENKLKNNDYLSNTTLKVLQNENSEKFNEYKYIVELKRRDSLDLINKTKEIDQLRQELNSVYSQKIDVPFTEVAKEIKLNYSQVTKVSFSEILVTNFSQVDTIPTFNLIWKDSISPSTKEDFQKRLSDWLSYKLNVEKLKVEISY
ncbi:uncharacterized hydrophobic domain-containing protein [Psychroflexus salarius]|uniref:Uncharacterized hydrophobic domain-containing protein n=1 Tax=Psychroflexus salarius TaxID=1155689 RepID=A0A1M4XR28_9FLAO|nr:DUF389 domain-containing protein [Psychroflexus salarius]SHE95692.1 uncharacterized hydrophobic domain-containing protein [Psychroflexus salarius]